MRARRRSVLGLLVLGLLAAMTYALLRPVRVRRQMRAVARWARTTPAEPTLSVQAPPAVALPSRAGRAPNVLLVLVDTLRADHLGTYGYSRPTSPYLDALAAQGVVFERAMAPAPWTVPTVRALMSGRYPSDLGLSSPWSAPTVPARVATLAERFQAAGYRTLALSDHPGLNVTGFGRGFERFDALPQDPAEMWGWAETEAATLLERWRRLIDGPDGRPTFAYVHLYYPHAPYEPPAPFDVLFGLGAPYMHRTLRSGVVNLYDGEIRRTDALLASLLPAFWRLAVGSEDSVTALVSDHGEAFWEHAQWGHGESLYNELLHVPFILHAPGRVAPGLRVADLVEIVDVGATLLDLAALELPTEPDQRGRTLLPRVLGRASPDPERWALSESPVRGAQTRAIQTRAIKVIQAGASAVAYRLLDDPGELRPLDLAQVPGSLRLNEALSALRAPERGAGIGPESLEALKALGYVFDEPHKRP